MQLFLQWEEIELANVGQAAVGEDHDDVVCLYGT